MWLITNKLINEADDINIISFKNYTFITDEVEIVKDNMGYYWFNEGYVLPKINSMKCRSSLKDRDLLIESYKVYRDKFINFVKGNYIIGQLSSDGFKIFSDHFGIKKFFYWQSNSEFIISNDLKAISKVIKLKPDPFGMAVYAMMYHFTGGLTAFEDVYHNQPGEYLELKNGKLEVSYYWKPGQLLDIPQKDIEIQEIAESLTNAVKVTLNFSEPVSLSLTGGADSRILLAVFLTFGIKPHLYTYGNLYSADCVVAAEIANTFGLEHKVYDIKMTADLFEANAKRIISDSGGLASIHPTHRLLAVNKESEYVKQMYLGMLGGEFVKGVSLDGDNIVPKMVIDSWANDTFSLHYMEKYLDAKRISLGKDLKEKLYSALCREPYMVGPLISKKHNALSCVAAHLHHAQNINLFNGVIGKVYTPYLDLDYLETLFASKYSFDSKEAIESRFLRRIENPVYSSRIINIIYPPLLNIKSSRQYKFNEVLFNKYIAALLKLIRDKYGNKYPPNFALNGWMIEFVKRRLPLCKNYPAIDHVFDLDKLTKDLAEEEHETNEAYWLKYTTPIMMSFIIDEYCCG